MRPIDFFTMSNIESVGIIRDGDVHSSVLESPSKGILSYTDLLYSEAPVGTSVMHELGSVATAVNAGLYRQKRRRKT